MGFSFSFKNKKRKRKKISRSYDAASKGRRLKNWKAPSSSADSALRGSLITLRNRSRDLSRNDPYAKEGIEVLVDEIVGAGIIGTIRHPNKETQKKLNDIFQEWANSKQPDFDGRHTLYGLQRLVMREAIEGGDVLARSRIKRSGFPLEFQILEGDHLPIEDTFTVNGSNNEVIHGIEFNEEGKRVAYHVLKNHPGNFQLRTARETVRIETKDMAHIYKVDRAGQTRGVPEMAAIMLRLRQLNDYEDAQLERQRIAACFAIFIHDIEGAEFSSDDEDDEEAKLISKVEPGLIEVLPEGKDVKAFNPPTTEGYKEFVGVNLHAVATGLGISYEALTKDFSDTNFSSARMGWLRMQKTTMKWRRHVLKPLFLDFVAQKFLQIAFLRGENVAEAKVIWTPPKATLVDPTKEIPAQIRAIRAGLSSIPDAIRQMGNDPEEHLNEISEWNDKIDELGLILDSDPRKTTQSGALQSNNEETESDPEEED